MKYVVALAFIVVAAGCGGAQVRGKAAGTWANPPAEEPREPAPPRDTQPPLNKDYVDLLIDEPLGVDWPPQLVTVPARFEKPCRTGSLDLRDSWNRALPFQVVDPKIHKKSLTACSIALITGLAAGESRSFRLYYGESEPEPPKPGRKQPLRSPLLTPDSLLKSVLSTGKVSLRVLTSSGKPGTPIPADAAPAPIEAVMGADNVWRGHGGLRSPYRLEKWEAKVLAHGPVFAQVWIRYDFAGKRWYEVTLNAVAGTECITVTERFDVGGGSCLILRGINRSSAAIAQHTRPETEGSLVTRLPAHAQPATINGLPAKRFESVAVADGADLWAVFTVEPGRWQNPIGSEINFISLNDSLAFHFPLGRGVRRWGIYASTLEEGSSAAICRRIAQAADASLDAVLRMELLHEKTELVLLKEEPEVPDELRRLADDLAAPTCALVEQGYSGAAAQALDFDKIAGAARAWAGMRMEAVAKAEDDSSPTARLAYARLAFLGYALADASFFNYDLLLAQDAPPAANLDPYSIGWLWNLRRIAALAEIAGALAGHPRAFDWQCHARSQAVLTLKHLVTPEGAWLAARSREDADDARKLLARLADTLNMPGKPDLRTEPHYKELMQN